MNFAFQRNQTRAHDAFDAKVGAYLFHHKRFLPSSDNSYYMCKLTEMLLAFKYADKTVHSLLYNSFQWIPSASFTVKKAEWQSLSGNFPVSWKSVRCDLSPSAPIFSSPEPCDQLEVTRDQSDYCWYESSVTIHSKEESRWIGLQLEVMDEALVWVNGEFVGALTL